MAETNIDEFKKRMRAAEKKQARGRVLSNLKPGGAGGIHIPWMAFVTVVALLFLLKAFIVLRIGENGYRAQIASYQDPALGQKIGLFVMDPDPVTLRLRDFVKPIVAGRR